MLKQIKRRGEKMTAAGNPLLVHVGTEWVRLPNNQRMIVFELRGDIVTKPALPINYVVTRASPARRYEMLPPGPNDNNTWPNNPYVWNITIENATAVKWASLGSSVNMVPAGYIIQTWEQTDFLNQFAKAPNRMPEP
jgi:hypothetical protein